MEKTVPTMYLEFEKVLVDIDKRLETLRRLSSRSDAEQAELTTLEEQCRQQETEVYSSLSSWQQVQLSRHTDRPYTLEHFKQIC
jgi:acetyl-CoA carboxylase carboxyl transferase subunit alpha